MSNKEQEKTTEQDGIREETVSNDNTPETGEHKELTIEEQLEEAKNEIERLKTQQLYKQAEFDNYRKRVIGEKADLILNGGQKVLEAMLPVVDDLERALANMDSAEDVAAVREGVDLINKKFLNVLKSQGVTPIDTTNADFNTDLHEAIAQLPAPNEEMKGKIMDCTEKGYMINDKVLRYAKVVVCI
ncbi:MAG: nucleotide exchange factor GrpE [Bacteroidales bacterium]|nr:nucleotide exchange factor GrpE [Candidatus Physcousia equi]